MFESHLLNIDTVAGTGEDQTGFHRFGEAFGLHGDFFLLLSGEIDEVVVFSPHQEWDGGLVEASPLSVPFFDAVESGLAGQVEHEENGYGIVAHEW